MILTTAPERRVNCTKGRLKRELSLCTLTIDKHNFLWYNIDTKEETRYIKMTTLDKAVRNFGFEDARTITIAFLEEQGKMDLAEKLWETLTAYEEYEDDWDDYDRDYEPDVDECGFDPYEGCYTGDC